MSRMWSIRARTSARPDTDGIKSVSVIIFRQPGANIIETVDRIRSQLPFLEAVLPQGINTTIVMDRTTTIRASVRNVETTLIGSDRPGGPGGVRLSAQPARHAHSQRGGSGFADRHIRGDVPAGLQLDNLSLMALTVATGFVVDDAIVVMENITRHLEAGMEPFAAALQGAKEIGFTVFSISMSLIAVFIPILMMGGIVGRLFREFAVLLSAAIRGFDGGLPDNHAHHVRALAEGAAAGRAAHVLYRLSERFFTGCSPCTATR